MSLPSGHFSFKVNSVFSDEPSVSIRYSVFKSSAEVRLVWKIQLPQSVWYSVDQLSYIYCSLI